MGKRPTTTCVLTGNPISATPEEEVRQYVAWYLLDQRGYGSTELRFELEVRIGASRCKADIAAFPVGAPHAQETATLLVECKKARSSLSEIEGGIAQLKSYMAACTNARFGLFYAGEGHGRCVVLQKIQHPNGAFESVEIGHSIDAIPDAQEPKRASAWPRVLRFVAIYVLLVASLALIAWSLGLRL